MILPHGSYLLNCGSSDPKILHESRESLVDDLQRCRTLGLPHFNFHPGIIGINIIGIISCALFVNIARSSVAHVTYFVA